MTAASLVWAPAPGFLPGRAFDTTHGGTVWRIALALTAEPVGMPWVDEQPCDGWLLYKAEGGRMQPIAAASRGLPLVKCHAAIRICPRGIHR